MTQYIQSDVYDTVTKGLQLSADTDDIRLLYCDKLPKICVLLTWWLSQIQLSELWKVLPKVQVNYNIIQSYSF